MRVQRTLIRGLAERQDRSRRAGRCGGRGGRGGWRGPAPGGAGARTRARVRGAGCAGARARGREGAGDRAGAGIARARGHACANRPFAPPSGCRWRLRRVYDGKSSTAVRDRRITGMFDAHGAANPPSTTIDRTKWSIGAAARGARAHALAPSECAAPERDGPAAQAKQPRPPIIADPHRQMVDLWYTSTIGGQWHSTSRMQTSNGSSTRSRG